MKDVAPFWDVLLSVQSEFPDPWLLIVGKRATNCFHHLYSISWFIKSRLMKWTAHMEQCLRDLNHAPEVPGDLALVAAARLVKLISETSAISWKQTQDMSSPEFQPPDFALMRAFRTNLEDIKLSSPDHVLNDSKTTFVSMIRSREANTLRNDKILHCDSGILHQ